MHWIAMQPGLEACQPSACDPPAKLSDPLLALGWWALRYTPQVALVAGCVVLEVSASQRLWGGLAPLLRSVHESNKPVAPVLYGQGATSLVAIARLQAPEHRRSPPDDLPLHTLAAAQPHLGPLATLGCTRWGQLRALPRGGVARRFGAPVLDALDRAYGLQAEVYPWLALPEVFEAQLELNARIDNAPALLFGATRLLRQLQLWLQLRQRGVLALALGWTLDARRDGATQGELTVRTSDATSDITHLQRLLAEHLARVNLSAPALYLHLRSLDTQALPGHSASLLPDTTAPGEPLPHLLERLSARLGSAQVRQWQAHADHRPEHMQAWQPVFDASQLIATRPDPIRARGPKQAQPGAGVKARQHAAPSAFSGTPHAHTGTHTAAVPRAAALYPTWLLAEPRLLAMHAQRPLYHGPLTLLGGPQRLEAVWWQAQPSTLRDYFLAHSDRAGLLWIYRERLPTPQACPAWYLHGWFG